MIVSVVLKNPKLEVLRDSRPDQLEYLAHADPDAYAELVTAAEQQQRSVDRVIEALDALGVEARVRPRQQFDGPDEGAALVVAVGGDGTVLDVSHRVVGVPLVGINSDPDRSVGYFCAARAENCAGMLRAFMEDTARVVRLHRIAIDVDGVRHPFPCMNDILVTNQNPGMMSRYVLTAGQRSEKQASSGVWISTPAGSTAGIRSAGGTVMPLEGALVQYLVREPYAPGSVHYELLRGIRHLREGLSLRSLMDGGRLYIDGPHITAPFPLGATLRLSEGPSLDLVGIHPELRER